MDCPTPPFPTCANAMAYPCWKIPYVIPAPMAKIDYKLLPCCPPVNPCPRPKLVYKYNANGKEIFYK